MPQYQNWHMGLTQNQLFVGSTPTCGINYSADKQVLKVTKTIGVNNVGTLGELTP